MCCTEKLTLRRRCENENIHYSPLSHAKPYTRWAQLLGGPTVFSHSFTHAMPHTDEMSDQHAAHSSLCALSSLAEVDALFRSLLPALALAPSGRCPLFPPSVRLQVAQSNEKRTHSRESLRCSDRHAGPLCHRRRTPKLERLRTVNIQAAGGVRRASRLNSCPPHMASGTFFSSVI